MPCQRLSALRFTQASTVPVDPRSSEPASGIETSDVEPSNRSPWPYFPATHVAAVTVPLLPLPETSAVDAPAPSLNGYSPVAPGAATAPLLATIKAVALFHKASRYPG